MKTIKDLKKEYKKADANKTETFTIDGYEFYTPYAKYLLEYLESIKIPADTPLKSFLVKAGAHRCKMCGAVFPESSGASEGFICSNCGGDRHAC